MSNPLDNNSPYIRVYNYPEKKCGQQGGGTVFHGGDSMQVPAFDHIFSGKLNPIQN